MIGLLSILFLLAAPLQTPASSTKPTAPQRPEPTSVDGTYMDETGTPIVVSTASGQTTLQSGPSTFTLVSAGPDQFSIPERDLKVVFGADNITISEGTHVVAKGRRGAALIPTPDYQSGNLSSWLDRNVPMLLARYHVPAAAIAYVDRGKVVWTKTFGESRQGVAADQHTLFNVASLTKPITAEIILRLVSQHRLDLDAPMAPIYVDPDLVGDMRVNALTLRMALMHRTGLPNWRGQTGNLLRFVTNPGSQFRYSGEGYTYAAHYAERVTQTPFETLAADEVFKPLGMNETHYTFVSDYKEHAARPHDALGREIWPLLRFDYSGACCLFATVGDYAKLLTAVMNDEALTSALQKERFLRDPARRDELCVKNDGLPVSICPPYGALGLGWFVYGFPGETVINHTGINDGERSAVFFVPEKRFGMVILTNGANGAKLVRDVTHAAYNNPAYLRIVDHLAS